MAAAEDDVIGDGSSGVADPEPDDPDEQPGDPILDEGCILEENYLKIKETQIVKYIIRLLICTSSCAIVVVIMAHCDNVEERVQSMWSTK
jgi:hypothetical protein